MCEESSWRRLRSSRRISGRSLGAEGASVGVLRGLELRKAPSVAETIDWARTLLTLGLDTLDDAAARATLGVVLKQHSDAQKAAAELRLN